MMSIKDFAIANAGRKIQYSLTIGYLIGYSQDKGNNFIWLTVDNNNEFYSSLYHWKQRYEIIKVINADDSLLVDGIPYTITDPHSGKLVLNNMVKVLAYDKNEIAELIKALDL